MTPLCLIKEVVGLVMVIGLYLVLGFSPCSRSKQVYNRSKCCVVCNGYVDLRQDTTVIKGVCLGLSRIPYVIFDEVIKNHSFLDELDTLLE